VVATERSIEANGPRFHYYDWGGSGRAVVLLHGLASNARIWDLVAPLLAEQLRVVAVDQRSHGLTAGPESGYGFDETTADLAAVIAALGLERPIIAGHSWGASVAVEFAARYPDLPSGIVLVDGGIFSPRSDGASWAETERCLAPPRLAGTPRARLLEMVRSGDLGGFWRPEFEAIIMAGFESLPEGRIAPRLSYERHLQIVRALWETDTRARFPEIRCPVLLLPAIRGDSEGAQRERDSARREGFTPLPPDSSSLST
jgi:pimeloyl-ACP methyl ester carboxylesterase